MKEILETVIKGLVMDKNNVSINEIENENSVVLEVKVATTDMGRVIGREGRMAKAIRTLTKAIAAKEGKRVNVEFID